MDILQIIGIAIVGALLSLILKTYRPEVALQIALATGIVIFISIAATLSSAVEAIMALADKYGIDSGYIGTVIRIIGIAYICQFTADVCKDAGETAVASKIEFAAKVLMLIYAIPIVDALLQMIISIIP